MATFSKPETFVETAKLIIDIGRQARKYERLVRHWNRHLRALGLLPPRKGGVIYEQTEYVVLMIGNPQGPRVDPEHDWTGSAADADRTLEETSLNIKKRLIDLRPGTSRIVLGVMSVLYPFTHADQMRNT